MEFLDHELSDWVKAISHPQSPFVGLLKRDLNTNEELIRISMHTNAAGPARDNNCIVPNNTVDVSKYGYQCILIFSDSIKKIINDFRDMNSQITQVNKMCVFCDYYSDIKNAAHDVDILLEDFQRVYNLKLFY